MDETKTWFDRASLDLRAAGVDLEANPPLTEDAVFHCQQAVEKAMKGFLTWHDRPFRKIHDLGELGVQCCEIDPTLADLLKTAAGFTEYATAFRYPGASLAPEASEAKESLDLARRVVSAVLERLPEDVSA